LAAVIYRLGENALASLPIFLLITFLKVYKNRGLRVPVFMCKQ